MSVFFFFFQGGDAKGIDGWILYDLPKGGRKKKRTEGRFRREGIRGWDGATTSLPSGNALTSLKLSRDVQGLILFLMEMHQTYPGHCMISYA